MKAALVTVHLVVLLGTGVLTLYWPPAAFAFLVSAPLALLGVRTAWLGGLSPRAIFVTTACLSTALLAGLALRWPVALAGFALVGPLVGLGLYDMQQRQRAVLRNFPVVGHARYLLESIRPELQQYFVESNTDGRPFSREERSLVYQRAKGQRDTLPFGTQNDVGATGYEWINHSLAPKPPADPVPRVEIGAASCARPYRAALLNVSAMSYGALSAPAITALNRAAREGRFFHNTGEGSISPHHLQGGALVWQLGTGYFGCRDEQGRFDPGRFRERAAQDAVKMIEVKLSQGAKPGHGGILPAAKITREIAEIRGVALDRDVISPPAHSSFATPIELLEFVTRLRELSGGKPVGFKLCIGKRREFLAIAKAMVETRLHPDFITVDGAEGGTGAAPLEFSNRVGCPLSEALVFAHNTLEGVGVRDRVRLIASGRIISGFDLTRLLALGADLCTSARAMMLSLGCIQARRCNANDCPTGVATQDPALSVGLDVDDKSERVLRYQHATVHAALELIGAAGLAGPEELRPWHILRRVSPTEVRHYGELFEYLESGALLGDVAPAFLARAWSAARSTSFAAAAKTAEPAAL